MSVRGWLRAWSVMFLASVTAPVSGLMEKRSAPCCCEARLYCTVLHCTVLYCTVLYCTALYCTVLYCSVVYCTAHQSGSRSWLLAPLLPVSPLWRRIRDAMLPA